MATPGFGTVSCPLQLNEGDIPIVWHDIRSGVQGLRRTWRTLQHLDLLISPFHVNDIPVTPHANPITWISSNHIVRFWDSEPPPQLVHRYVVDLLMRDEDLYFVAFRRGRFTVEQFEAAQAGVGEGQGLGRWFSLKSMVVPSFLHATETEISSSHNGACPGGEMVFENTLYALARFETDNGEPGPLTPDVQRAAWNVMVVFCEIRRLRNLLMEVNQRIQYGLPPQPLLQKHWNLIRSWSNFSKIVLEERLSGTLALPNLSRHWCIMYHRKTTMVCLIGIYGELLTIKLDVTLLGLTVEEFEHQWRLAGGNVPEPGFVPQM